MTTMAHSGEEDNSYPKLFGTSKYRKKTDPSLLEYTDDQLLAELVQRTHIPGYIADDEIRRDLATREHNRSITTVRKEQ